MSEHQPLNPEQITPKQGYEKIAADLLASKELQELPDELRGTAIVDRFIGALVREGGAVSGNEAINQQRPEEILYDMDHMQDEGALRHFTRANGLRSAVKLLAEHEDVAPVLGGLSQRLGVAQDARGNTQYVFHSVGQIEGYLEAGGNKNYIADARPGIELPGKEWMQVMLERLEGAVDPRNSTTLWQDMAGARTQMTSDLPYLRQAGRDWQAAEYSAQRVGVDTALIGRSVEYIQEQQRAHVDVGATALSAINRSMADQYRQRLNRSSSF